MENNDIDKETIIQSSSDNESDHRRRTSKSRSHRRHKHRSRSRKRHSSTNGDSSREMKRKYEEKYDEKYENKYKHKEYSKDRTDTYLKEKDHHKHRSRHRRSRSRSRSKSRRSRSRSRSNRRDRHQSKKYDHTKSSKHKRRSHSSKRSSIYSNRQKSKSPFKDTSYQGTKEILNSARKKLEELSQLTNDQAPISNTDISKRDRELYVSNLPAGLSPSDAVELMNTAMVAMGASLKSGNPVLSAWLNPEQEYALLEFRSPEETVNAFKLDGLSMLGKAIKIGRPRYQDEINAKKMSNLVCNKNLEDMFPTLSSFEKDLNNPYLNRALTSGGMTSLAPIRSNPYITPASSKLLVSNLPRIFDEKAVRKMLKDYGKIKFLEMIRDPVTNESTGQCHVEYETEKATQDALHYLMGISLMGNIIYIKRSSGLVPTYSASALGGNVVPGLGIIAGGSLSNPSGYMNSEDYAKYRETTPSKVLCIKNMVSMRELEDNEEYEDLYDDVMEECKNYGKVLNIKIPRPNGSNPVSGIGKVYVEYANRDGASWAKEHLNGMTFKNRIVEVVNYPEENYKKNQFD